MDCTRELVLGRGGETREEGDDGDVLMDDRERVSESGRAYVMPKYGSD